MPDGERFVGNVEASPTVESLQKELEALKEKLYVANQEKELLEDLLEKERSTALHFEQQLHLDHLTQLKNRHAFENELQRSLALLTGSEKEHRHNVPTPKRVSLICIDLDHFKQVNDTYGHPFGDLVLKRVAATFREKARETDCVARLGGEEFGIILRDTDEESTLRAAEKFRKALEKIDFSDTDVPDFSLTGSFGIASSDDATDPEMLYKYADRALYTAKTTGRNSVVEYKTIHDEHLPTTSE